MPPVYDISCQDSDCGAVSEVIEKFAQFSVCPVCGQPAERIVCAPQRTPTRWGDGASYMDRGLGMEIKNSQHRDAVMKARGLAPASDFSKYALEESIEKRSAPPKALPTTMIATPADVARGRRNIERARARKEM